MNDSTVDRQARRHLSRSRIVTVGALLAAALLAAGTALAAQPTPSDLVGPASPVVATTPAPDLTTFADATVAPAPSLAAPTTRSLPAGGSGPMPGTHIPK
jgi:hypothetical protein